MTSIIFAQALSVKRVFLSVAFGAAAAIPTKLPAKPSPNASDCARAA
jgi:hypothetical protein